MCWFCHDYLVILEHYEDNKTVMTGQIQGKVDKAEPHEQNHILKKTSGGRFPFFILIGTVALLPIRDRDLIAS